MSSKFRVQISHLKLNLIVHHSWEASHDILSRDEMVSYAIREQREHVGHEAVQVVGR